MENISVSVRVRPLNKHELLDGFAWRCGGSTLWQRDPAAGEQNPEKGPRDTRYGVDHVFSPEHSTADLYRVTTQPLIHKVVSGFNSTVFAYGQTSSGKTFTMRGTPEEPGIIPLAVHEVFSLIEQTQDREFLLRVSYIELYNEDINDLLGRDNFKLPIHESKESGVYVAGLREDIVCSPEQALELLEEGEANRHIGSTRMNEKSSRSHTVFRMVTESRLKSQSDEQEVEAGAILVSTLTLVDLAGSERVAKTGAEGLRMKEGTAINKSLLTLGTVINKLSEGVQLAGGHIPYRDSKLTRILQPSLGGNAKTAIICNITPAACHVEESHSTLRFACRANRVVNNAIVNEVLSDAAVLKRQAKEIEELKRRLGATGLSSDVEEQIANLRAELLRAEQDRELMRLKLEEEVAEKEKAQKQAEVAKKLMFRNHEQESMNKKQNRRETWCPGQSAWQPPTKTGTRKRPMSSMEGEFDGTSADSCLTSVMEGDEGYGDEGELKDCMHDQPSSADMDGNRSQKELAESLADANKQAGLSSQQPDKGDAEALQSLQNRFNMLEQENTFLKEEIDSVSDLVDQKEKSRRELILSLEALQSEKDVLIAHQQELVNRTEQLERFRQDVQSHPQTLLNSLDIGVQVSMYHICLCRTKTAGRREHVNFKKKVAENETDALHEAEDQQVRRDNEDSGKLQAEIIASREALKSLGDALSQQKGLTLEIECAKDASERNLREELDMTKEAAEREVKHLQDMLSCAQDAASTQFEQLNASTSLMQSEIEQLRSKLLEATSAVHAKEDTKESRAKHKQELAALRSDLQKLQQESRSGQKGKDILEKEMEAMKKRHADVELKLKGAISDKQAALQDKSNLERQLKSAKSQIETLGKNLAKRETAAEKKLEAVNEVYGKTKNQLSALEEQHKVVTTQIQRWDGEIRSNAGTIQELTANIASTTSKHSSCLDELTKLNNDYQVLIDEKAGLSKALFTEQDTIKQLQESKQWLEDEISVLRPAHDELVSSHTDLIQQISHLQTALQKAEEAWHYAEGRLPEIEELQKQMTLTNEDLTDLKFQLSEAHEANTTLQQRSRKETDQLNQNLDARTAEKETLQGNLKEVQQQATTMERRLEEMYDLNTDTQDQLKCANTEKQHLCERLQSAVKEVETKTSRIQELAQKLEKYETDMEGLTNKLSETADELIHYQNLVSEAEEKYQEEKSQAAEQLAKLKEDNAIVEGNLRDTSKQLEEVRMEYHCTHNKLGEVVVKEEQQRNQIQKLQNLQEQQLLKLSEEREHVQGELSAIQQTADQLQLEIVTLKEENEDVQRNRQSLQLELETAKQLAVETQEKLQSLKASNIQLEKCLQQKEESLHECQAQLSECQASLKASQDRANEELAKVLEDQHMAAQLLEGNMNETITKINQENEMLKSKESELSSTNADVQARLSELRREFINLQGCQSKSVSIQEDLQQQLARMQEMNESGQRAEAERNAKILQLESRAHWLMQENEELKRAEVATEAASEQMPSARMEQMETELRKSKRAEQKLQALLFRLRKDVQSCGGNMVQALEGMQELRSLEYEMDFMTNRCKKLEQVCQQAEKDKQQLQLQFERLHFQLQNLSHPDKENIQLQPLNNLTNVKKG